MACRRAERPLLRSRRGMVAAGGRPDSHSRCRRQSDRRTRRAIAQRGGDPAAMGGDRGRRSDGTRDGLTGPGPLTDLMRWLLPTAVAPDDPDHRGHLARGAHPRSTRPGRDHPGRSALINADLAALTGLPLRLAPAGDDHWDLRVRPHRHGCGGAVRGGQSLAGFLRRPGKPWRGVIWRFSPTSVRRAFDQGASGDELIRALAAVAGGRLPQPLTYLIRDVERRHGVADRPAGAQLCPVGRRGPADRGGCPPQPAGTRPNLLAPTVIACARATSPRSSRRCGRPGTCRCRPTRAATDASSAAVPV